MHVARLAATPLLPPHLNCCSCCHSALVSRPPAAANASASTLTTAAAADGPGLPCTGASEEPSASSCRCMSGGAVLAAISCTSDVLAALSDGQPGLQQWQQQHA